VWQGDQFMAPRKSLSVNILEKLEIFLCKSVADCNMLNVLNKNLSHFDKIKILKEMA